MTDAADDVEPTADETAERDDEVAITDDGQIHLVVAGAEYWLKRPTIGVMRDLEERVVSLAQADVEVAQRLAKAVKAAAAQVAADNDAEINLDDDKGASDRLDALLAWWQDVVAALDRRGRHLPDEVDDLPAWLASWDLVRDVRQAWRAVPYRPGGRPKR